MSGRHGVLPLSQSLSVMLELRGRRRHWRGLREIECLLGASGGWIAGTGIWRALVVVRIEWRRQLQVLIVLVVPTAIEAAYFPLDLENCIDLPSRAEVLEAG